MIQIQTDHNRQQGAHGGGEAHGEEGGGEEEGGGVGAGDADGEDGNHVVEEGEIGFPAGREVAGEAEVDAGDGAVNDVGVEVMGLSSTLCKFLLLN